MGKAMGLENLAGFLHPTLSERGGAGEGRGESHRRGERTSRHGAGRSAPPAVPRFRADRRARTPSLPPPEAVAVGQHRRPVACCRRCSWRAPCPAPSAFVAPCRPPPSPSGRPAARRRGWIWPSHGHRRPSAAPTPLTPAPLGGSSKEADLAALPPSPPVRRSRTADLADAALASAGTPPLLRRRFRRSAQRHRHLRRFLCPPLPGPRLRSSCCRWRRTTGSRHGGGCGRDALVRASLCCEDRPDERTSPERSPRSGFARVGPRSPCSIGRRIRSMILITADKQQHEDDVQAIFFMGCIGHRRRQAKASTR
ncbi:Os11g0547800 [Oryza sativa Japonica Group]|uniref:Os11g0547800 protein n=1 Tax=Oryza sativa subsp. japonica TaxID=39947 RepID=A0A0P0Y332_ORYSJ|nr:hypothetical protein EE612_056047 [Oryza sativa]BAT14391.1 Os11g0547800 [Oryza sativa Japonica Group]